MELVFDNVNSILVIAIFAVSYNLLCGYSGQLSLAHGAFGAIGGYAMGYLWLNDGLGFVGGTAIGIALAVLAGLAVGVVVIRLTPEWFMLTTFAVQVVVISLATTTPELGGTVGLQQITGLSIFGQELDEPGELFPVVLALTLFVVAVCHRLGESPYGRVLRSIRDDEVASRSLGRNAAAYKLTVFAVTSGMAALGGALFVAQNAVATPSMFDAALSILVVSVVIIGGSGNLVGTLVAAILIVLSGPFLRSVVNLDPTVASLWRLGIYGMLLVLVLYVRPQGLVPEGTMRLRWRRRSEPDTGYEAPLIALPAVSTNGAAPPVLEVRGLQKRFGGIVAADGLDLVLPRGEITALVGPNGAGKTTLFNLLTGAVQPDSGRVFLRGEEITGMAPHQVARKGMVRSFQDVRVFSGLSVEDNVKLGVRGQPGERFVPLFLRPRHVARTERAVSAAARHWLDVVGLAELAEVRVSELGFAEQKLVALARALASEADVLLLDEPASGIDARWIDPILQLIRDSRDQGRTICIVEHNLQVVERLADQVWFMELGRVTARGTFAELTRDKRLAEAYFSG